MQMWLIFRCLCFGFCFFLMMQGLIDLLGISKSTPAIGAIVGGVLSIPNWIIIEREISRWRTEKCEKCTQSNSITQITTQIKKLFQTYQLYYTFQQICEAIPGKEQYINIALLRLVAEGYLVHNYRIKNDDGTIDPKPYPSLEDIPNFDTIPNDNIVTTYSYVQK